MAKTELGIDEAGRGAIIGPMILAGVITTAKTESILEIEGIKDSKLFGSTKKAVKERARLADVIKSLCPHLIIKVTAEEIDRSSAH